MDKIKPPIGIKILDSVGSKLKKIFPQFNQLTSKPIHLLAIHIGDLTETLQILPAIQLISEELPETHIDCMIGEWSKPLLTAVPAVSDIVIFNAPWIIDTIPTPELPSTHGVFSMAWELRRRQYDTIISFMPDVRLNILAALCHAPRRIGYGYNGGGFFLTHDFPENTRIPIYQQHLNLLRSIDIKPAFIAPRFNPTKDDKASTRTILDGFNPGKPIAAVYPGTDLNLPPWPAREFQRVIDDLIKNNFQILLLGGPGKSKISEIIRNSYTIDDLQIWNYPTSGEIIALAGFIALYFGVDASTSRLMAAAGAPAFILMNHTSFQSNAPFGPKTILIKPPSPCPHCLENTAATECKCIELIHSDQVIDAYQKYIKQNSTDIYTD